MRRFVFIGDYSGLSLFLARGLERLGYETLLLSNGDHWKNIPRSRNLWRPRRGRLGTVYSQLAGYPSLLRTVGKDDIILMSSEYLYPQSMNGAMLALLFRQAGAVSLLHAGCTDSFNAVHNHTALCASCKQHDLRSQDCKFRYDHWFGQSWALRRIQTVVPFTSAYRASAVAYGAYGIKVTDALPFPIDAEYVQCLATTQPASKPVLHGLNRPGFKGTAYLESLLRRSSALSQWIQISQRMPFVDYLGAISASKLVLDQLFADGYGMNGVISLALGRAVAFGCLNRTPSDDFQGTGCIPINITLDPATDTHALLAAIQGHLDRAAHPDDIRTTCYQRHNHIEVARQLIDRLGIAAICR